MREEKGTVQPGPKSAAGGTTRGGFMSEEKKAARGEFAGNEKKQTRGGPVGDGNKANEAGREPYAEELVREVREDFARRQSERRSFELTWRLNQCYLAGREARVSARGELEPEERRYEWQETEVFNHIAPIVDTRCAKLGRVRPAMAVRAAGPGEDDLYAAKLATQLLKSMAARTGLPEKIGEATMWSESLGTVFYRLGWNPRGGRRLSPSVWEGEVDIAVLPAYEVYPENLWEADLQAQPSILLARAVPVGELSERYGREVEAEAAVALSPGFGTQALESCATLIERFEKPSARYPGGRYLAVAGQQLLSCGELPYRVGPDGAFAYPLVRQTAIELAGRFFGTSVVERLIPVQRAYNAVKNRKFEYLGRIAAGVYAVEDGSVDVEELEEEGLRPGKIVQYRQGSRPPFILDYSRVPADFQYEEDRLQNEFIRISGVSEITRNSQLPSGVSSGVALSLLVEQDETRLSVSAEHIRSALKALGGMSIRLYRQFATAERLLHAAGEGDALEAYYFTGSDLCADDVVFDTENELLETPAQKKSYLFDLLRAGLFADDEGRLSAYARAKLLDQLGYGGVESGQELVSLHVKQAARENLRLLREDAPISEIDDHALHLKEHVKYMLANNLAQAERFLAHIRLHEAASAAK